MYYLKRIEFINNFRKPKSLDHESVLDRDVIKSFIISLKHMVLMFYRTVNFKLYLYPEIKSRVR